MEAATMFEAGDGRAQGCHAIAGAANNQLLLPQHGVALQKKGILYAPDFVINDQPVEARCYGAIVDDLLWNRDDQPALPAANFYFTTVPPDAVPEIVLARLQYLRAQI